MTKHTIHECEVDAKQLPGRKHKMIIGPNNFGKAQNMCFGVAEFPPETKAPAHMHPKEEEIIYVLSGWGEIFFDREPEPMGPGICIYIPPGVEHAIYNKGYEVLKVAYVFSPPVVQGSYDLGSNE